MYNACACMCVCARACRRVAAGASRGRPSGQATFGLFFIIRIVSLLEACHRADAQGATELSTDSLLIF